MTPSERLARFRHDLANPLSAILAEAELDLQQAESLPPEITASLQAIHDAAIRMRAVLREGASD